MRPTLAAGLGTVAVVAAVLLLMTGHMVASAVAFAIGVAFDLLFVKALLDARKAKSGAAKGSAS